MIKTSMKPLKFLFISSFLLLFSCNKSKYDLIIKNGLIFDGNGTTPISADIALKNDTIAFIGNLSFYSDATDVIDAKGMAVAPGFVNMLSWSTESLIEDGRSMGDIMQGVTLEVMGEGDSKTEENSCTRRATFFSRNKNLRTSGAFRIKKGARLTRFAMQFHNKSSAEGNHCKNA